MRRTWVSFWVLGCLLPFWGSTAGCLNREVVEQEPNTSNMFVQRQDSRAVDKIDLLFVVDNSTSMADKQKILEDAVPTMLERLVQPDCVRLDENGRVAERTSSTPAAVAGDDPTCLDGTTLEFNPVNDIHIGVISSSLGGHGSSHCVEGEGNDRALLLPKVRPGLVDPHGTGFLVWRPKGKDGEPVEGDLERLSGHFREHVLGSGEEGCGFEAPLEAWFRFLVDPAPPSEISVQSRRSSPVGIDQAVLDQRAAFLRPDSLVAVVMLTDENDCSIMDGGSTYPNASLGWTLAEFTSAFPDVGGGPNATKYPVASHYCEQNPNHACCFSCFRDDLPPGCDDTTALDSCTSPGQPRLSAELDRPNVRCFDTKRRFGVDLLYPVERYVSAILSLDVPNQTTGEDDPNPLLLGIDGKTPRPPGLVFVGGITGVPWQDIATEESLTDETRLKYLTSKELSQTTSSDHSEAPFSRWDLIVGRNPASVGSPACEGDPQCGEPPTPPLDPFMQQSIEPRSGTNPLTGIAITSSPTWNPITGHEQIVSVPYDQVGGSDSLPARNDLQYSCIFPLAPYDGVKTDCTPEDDACDCGYASVNDRPLCKEGPSSPATTTQHFGKAYPSGRVLSVLRGIGENAVVASICPKVHDPASPDFGYNPAIAAIVDRLSVTLKGQCLPRQLSLDSEGRVPCAVVEVLHPREGELSCDAEGRDDVSAQIQDAVTRELSKSEYCLGDDCDDLTMCEVRQHIEGQARDECLNGPPGSEGGQSSGYCYVDPAQGLGDQRIVASCRSSERQLLRFVGPETPATGATVVVACAGEQPATSGVPDQLE